MGELDDLILRARRRLNFENTTAYLGDGSGRIYSGDKYLVRLKLASGFSDPFPVAAHPNANLPERDGLPVLLGTDEFGRDVILRAHYDVAGVAGTSSIIYNPLSNAAYGTVDSSKLTPFLWRIHPDETGKPFTVYVVVPLVLLTSSVVYPVTLEIDLASFVPAAGDHRFVCVFWKTDNTLAAYASTARHELDPLVESDMLQCVSAAPADAVPVCGWILTGGETALSKRPDRSFDMRQFVNLPGSGGGGGTVTSVGLAAPSDLLNVSGSPVTSSGTLTLAKPTDTAANRVYASPDGTAGAAAFRALASGDLPVVPISKGGTGQTTAAAGFNALSPLTTQGDLLTHNGTESVRLPIGGRGMLVHSNGAPTWYNTEYDRILDMKASGTAGGPSTAGSWQTRTLNTIELSTGFILALTGSAFRLKEGKYHIHVVSPFIAGATGPFVVRLRLARNGFAEIVGTNISAIGNGLPMTAMLSGVFTVTNTNDSYSIQYYTGSARSTNGLGAALSVTGESEIYTIVTLMRLLP